MSSTTLTQATHKVPGNPCNCGVLRHKQQAPLAGYLAGAGRTVWHIAVWAMPCLPNTQDMPQGSCQQGVLLGKVEVVSDGKSTPR